MGKYLGILVYIIIIIIIRNGIRRVLTSIRTRKHIYDDNLIGIELEKLVSFKQLNSHIFIQLYTSIYSFKIFNRHKHKLNFQSMYNYINNNGM